MHPSFSQFLRSGQSPYRQEEPRRVFNRSGAATVIGNIYRLDLAMTANAAETMENSKGDLLPAVTTLNWEPLNDASRQSTSGWNNMVGLTSVTSDAAVYVIAQEAVGNNESCLVLECGIVTLLVQGIEIGADDSATYPPNTLIIPLASTNTKVTVQNTKTASTRLGVTLESFTEAVTATTHSVSCFFCGWGIT